jgi:hypothetical protein
MLDEIVVELMGYVKSIQDGMKYLIYTRTHGKNRLECVMKNGKAELNSTVLKEKLTVSFVKIMF